MYNDLINCEVFVLVSTKSETVFEYSGILYDENEKTIKLKNVDINIAMLNFQKNVFGGSLGNYKQNVQEVVLNKDYVISCNKR